MIETRFNISELRAVSARSISGIALRYGDTARLPWGVSERIMPGAFGNIASADVVLNSMHRREAPLARTGGGGLTLTDSEAYLRATADLPETREASDVLELIRKKVLRGLSIEFVAEKEEQQGDERVIRAARLLGVAVVDKPAYPDSLVESMRARFMPQVQRVRSLFL